jgi:hypothetical protein
MANSQELKALEKKVISHECSGALIKNLKYLKQVQQYNLREYEIIAIIREMNFPLNLHLFITGNFSNLMSLNFN